MMRARRDDRRGWLWLGLQRQTVDARERLRDCVGALFGLWAAGGLTWWITGHAEPWLVATMGATAVLLFAVPSSPLAQPWPVMMGNVMSALVGVAVYGALGAHPLSAALAAALALALMFPLRCVHPPGGAVAITAVLGSPAAHGLGFGFALSPVALNSALLLLVAMAWRRMTRSAPAHAPVIHDNRHRTSDAAPQDRLGLTPADLDAALRDFNQLVDIDRDALEQLLRQAQRQAWQRHFGRVRCAEVMSRDIVTVEFATPLSEAWALLHHHRIKALPVTDRARRVIGIVTVVDFLKHAELDPRDHRSLGQRVRRLLAPTPGMHADKAEVVGQIMSSPVHTVCEDEPVVELVPRLSDQGLHHVPVVDADRRLAGMLTQSDLVAALYQAQVSV